MPTLRSSLWKWLLAVAWMCLIFAGSADRQSWEHSSRFVEPLLRWLFPGASAPALEAGVFFVRKCAHVTEYAVLASLVWFALREQMLGTDWCWRTAGLTFGCVVLYAATDEFHQTFIPKRQGCVTDVLVDSCGAVFALLFLLMFTRWKQRRLCRVTSRSGERPGF